MNLIRAISFMLSALCCLNNVIAIPATESNLNKVETATTTTTSATTQDLSERTTNNNNTNKFTIRAAQLKPTTTIANIISTDAKPSTTSPPSTTDSIDNAEPATTLIDGFVTDDSSSVGTPETGDNEETTTTVPTPADSILGRSLDRSAPYENVFDKDEDVKDSTRTSVESSPALDTDNVRTLESSADSAPAPPTVNMSAIDEMYVDGRKNEDETVESWKKMNKRLKKGVTGVLGSLIPFALNMTQETKISGNCSGAVLKWVLSMNQLKAWAMRMLDATGKPIAGLFEGSLTLFGNFRECLKVRAPDEDEMEFVEGFKEYFRGKYCIIQAKPWLPQKDRFYNLNTKLKSLMEEEGETPWYDRTITEELSEWMLSFNYVSLRLDLCVPSLCTRQDIQKATDYILRGIDVKARVLRCEMDAPNGTLGAVTAVETGDQDVAEALYGASTAPDDSSIHSFSQMGWIFVPVIAAIIVSLATCISMMAGNKGPNKLKHTIKSLSLKRSVSSYTEIDFDQLADDKPLALYGVRIILVLWVILVESAINLKFEFLRELLMLKDLIYWWPMQIIINSTLQFDSLILLTAFTMGYKNCLNNGIDNARSVFKFVLDKYMRLMPSIMVMVALVILFPLTYRGPVWNDYVSKQSAVCQSTGWVNIAFLQNYLSYKDICLPQTWLLCVEFQLIVLMAPVVYYLNKNYISHYGAKKNIVLRGINSEKQEIVKLSSSRSEDASQAFHWLWTAPGTILAACIVVGLGGSFYNVYYHDLPPSFLYTMADPDSKSLYFSGHMTKLWTHLAVFAMGILAGVECRRAYMNVLRGYRGFHSNNISTSSTPSTNKNQISKSALSLPVISQSDESISTNKGSSEMNSSVSINVDSNSQTQDSIASNCQMVHRDRSSSCKIRKTIRKRLLDTLGCIIVLGTMSAIIFSTHDWSLNDLPKPLIAGAFDACSRFLWSLALIWILFQVSVPNKNRQFSLLARLLGHPFVVYLGKLSFLIYVIHPFVHTAVLAIQEQPIYSSWLMLVHILIGNITLTVFLASCVSLFVEMPCRNLFRRNRTSSLLTS